MTSTTLKEEREERELIFLFTSSYVGYIVQNHNETVKEIVFVYRFFFYYYFT